MNPNMRIVYRYALIWDRDVNAQPICDPDSNVYVLEVSGYEFLLHPEGIDERYDEDEW